MNKILITISILFLFGCSGSKDVHLVLECKGITHVVEDSSKWGKKGQSWNTTKVIEVLDDMNDPKTKERAWRIIDSPVVHTNSHGNDPKQSGNPIWDSFVSVTDKEISVQGENSRGFDELKKDSDQMNQKQEGNTSITINRISGEWKEDRFYKTYWKDGSWVSSHYLVEGTCVKGSQKF